jgi:hypothetical protein
MSTPADRPEIASGTIYEASARRHYRETLQELREIGITGSTAAACARLGTNQADHTDIMIVLDGLRISPVVKHITKLTDKIGLFEGLRSERAPARMAQALDLNIRRFVELRHGMHFNPHDPTARVIAEADLLTESGIFSELDLGMDDPLVQQRIAHFLSTFDKLAQNGASQEPPKSTFDCYLGLQSFLQDQELYRTNRLRASRRPSLWQVIRDAGINSVSEELAVELKTRFGLIGQSDASYDLLYSRPGLIAEIMETAVINDDTELFGVCWAAALGTSQQELVENYRPFAETELEAYVVRGLPLLEKGVAPMWLLQVAIDQLYPHKRHQSLYTDQGFPAADDRRHTAESISEGLKTRFGAGFQPHAPEFWLGAEAWLHTAALPSPIYAGRLQATEARIRELKTKKLIAPNARGQQLRLPPSIVKFYNNL